MTKRPTLIRMRSISSLSFYKVRRTTFDQRVIDAVTRCPHFIGSEWQPNPFWISSGRWLRGILRYLAREKELSDEKTVKVLRRFLNTLLAEETEYLDERCLNPPCVAG